MSKFETASRHEALGMVSLALRDEFSPASPKLKQLAAALAPVRNLIREGSTYDGEVLKELCRTVKLAVFPDHPVIKDPGTLLETIIVNCIEWAFFALEVSDNKLPFEEKP